ncbi:PREDICTED: cholecystokinin receptor [Ceratosolen solmsi marchali]|uniref:Cholecystokinin receptor n=1 Tax=Ceratosolen solmsi marchali TaxID=326594 RepID=A0AAJ6VNE8_9HYME|nr:PREDICTED: cholecystokinin receptor [Ceratosolen solmsi marchali]
MLPNYIQIPSICICAIIIIIGITGNTMVLIIIMRGKDMNNSTNIFLLNLSIADLSVLLLCTPTILIEVISGPQVWILGESICKVVPFIESTVANTSVLTILAISFERYYAICQPFRANYICTRSRAVLICMLSWFIAGLFTSPFLYMVTFEVNYDEFGVSKPTCTTEARTKWSIVYILFTIVVFFIFPVIILIILYSIIVNELIQRSHMINDVAKKLFKNRFQIVRMLCTVIFIFFICLLPLRAMMMWVMFSPLQQIIEFGIEGYFCLLYFSRIMFYLNSALNPILYTLMSTKFKRNFLHLLH